MRKYNAVCVVDIDAEVLESTSHKQAEKVIKKRIEILLNGHEHIKVHDVSLKLRIG